MITYEQDPDIVRWGLDLLVGYPCSHYGYCGPATQLDVNIHDGGYIGECHYGMECHSVENAEVAAHASQEELSQFAVVEASESSQEEEHFQASDIAQDWLSLSMNNLNFGITRLKSCRSDLLMSSFGFM